ncbi:hypothetical protein [Blastococcus sp. SYSU DS0533]
MNPGGLPLVEADADPGAVLADLLAAGHGDGLPVVPPTAAGLGAMLGGVTAPDEELGLVPPLFGPLTVRSVAWYAVLAGCRPGELPVVVAACRAALEEPFNLLGLSTTTGAPAVAVLVHGPVARRLGMTSGAGGLGTGNRANACIGRAVSMALAGIGGATAGLTDMATIGQPAKYTCCTAEAARPLPSLAQRRGLGVDVDAVTVIGVGSVVEALPGEGYREPPSVLGPAAAAMAGVALASGDPRRAALGEQFLLLPPEPAELLAVHGWGYEWMAEFLFEQGSALLQGSAPALAFRAGLPQYSAEEELRVAASPSDVHVVVTGGAGVKMLLLPTWPGGSRSVTAPVRPLGPG